VIAEVNNNTDEEAPEELDLLKFDKKVFLMTILRKMHYPCIVSCCLLGIGLVITHYAIKNKWKSICTIYRHARNDTVKSEMPFMFGTTDIKTVIRTIKKNENLKTVIKKLDLTMPPGELSRMIDVSVDRNNIISITVTTPTQKTPDKIANTLAQTFLKSYIHDQNINAKVIYQQYSNIERKLENKIALLEKKSHFFLEKNQIISIESETNLKFQQLSDLELKAIDNKMNLAALRSRLKNIIKLMKGMKADTVQSYVISSSTQAAIKSVEDECAYLRQKFTDNNPKVKSLLDRLALMKAAAAKQTTAAPPSQKTMGPNAMKEAFEIRKLNTEIEIKSVTENIEKLKKAIATIKKKLTELTTLKDPYIELKREIRIQKDLLEKMQAIALEAKILMDSAISDFAILEHAIAPKFPESSKRKLIAIAIGFLGFAATFFIIVVLEFMDFSFKSVSEIEAILSIPAIGNLPDKDAVGSTVFHPAFQIFFDNFNKNIKCQDAPPMILVSSDCHQTGKSFIIDLFVSQYSKQGKKTLYIHSLPESNKEISSAVINDFLFNNASANSIETRKTSEHLFNAYFILDKKTLSAFIQKESLGKMKKIFTDFDIIIWETFNCQKNIQLFSDIALSADLTLFVAGFRQSSRTRLKATVEFLVSKDVKNLVAVLNNVDKRYYYKEV